MVNKILGRKSKGGSGSASTAREDPNTLTTNTIANAIFLFSEGPVEGLSTGDGKSIYFDDVPMIDPDGNTNHSGISWTFRNGLPDQEVIPGFPSASSITNVNTKVLFATPVVRTITGDYDALNVTISIPALAASDVSTGALKGTDLSYAIDIKTSSGSYVTVHTEDLIKQKTTSEWRRTYRCELPSGGSPWSVRVRRLTADSGSVNLQNDLFFGTYATVNDGKFNYRNSVVLGLSLPAKEFQGRVPTVKAKIKGIKVWVPKNYDPVARTYATVGVGTSGGIWDGTFKATYTDNPIWIYYDLLINNRYGLGQDFNPSDDPDNNLIDKWSLYPLAQFCDESVSDGFGGTEARYRVNIQITDKQEAYDLLQTIISTLNGMMYFSAEKVYAVADMPDTVDDIFTQADVVEGIFEYSGTALKTRHSAVISYFNDPNQLYQRAAVVYEDADLIDKYGYRSAEINNFGCTSRAQALRTAKWLLHTENKQTQTVTFKTGHRGGFLTPGQIIKIFDDYKAGQRMGGRILSTSGTSPNITFNLDQAISVVNGDKFLYLNVDGQLITCNLTSTYSGTALVVTNGSGLPVDGGVFAVVKPSLDGQLFRVIHVQEESPSEYNVIALQHDETKFAIIDADTTFDTLPTSIYSTDKLPSVTSVLASPWYETVSGTEAFPHITVSWARPADGRVANFEVQLKTPYTDYTSVFIGASTSWDSDRLTSDNSNGYSVRVRSIDLLDRTSDWAYYSAFSVPGAATAPSGPSGGALTAIVNGFTVTWTKPSMLDFKDVEVWTHTSNSVGSATKVADISDNFYTVNNLTPGTVRWVWLRTITHAITNNTSSFVALGSVTARGVDNTDLAGTFTFPTTGVPHGSALPTSGMAQGDLFFLTTDNKLYRYTGSAWTTAVPAVDITGTLTGSQITNGAIDLTKFAGGLTAVEIVSSLPTTGNFSGRTVFLSTDNKLYRYDSGASAFTAAVPTTDLSGTISTTQIANNAITTGKIAANTITASNIAAGAITTNEIAANTITAGNIAAATITGSRIAATTIAAANIVANTITAAQIAASTITATEIAAATITGNKIVAGTITGSLIAAETIQAKHLEIGTRGLDCSGLFFSFATNTISWPFFQISYVTNTGSAATSGVNSGSFTWSSGTEYIYWVQGASSLSHTTTASTAYTSGNIVIATYRGGYDVTTTYGNTVIDGNSIKTGSISASHISVSTLSSIVADIGTITAGTIRNSGSTTVFDVTNGNIKFVAGSRVLYEGNGFGASSDLIMWFGPSSTAIGSTTKTNGYWAFGTDGKVYYGTAELGTGVAGFNVTANIYYANGSRTGNGTVTTNTVTLTPHNNTGTVTYAWNPPSIIGITPTSPTGSSTAFSGNVTVGNDKETSFTVTATDGGSGAVYQLNIPVNMVAN
jgi:predicted phage tail protein